jgi:hypothetical protein
MPGDYWSLGAKSARAKVQHELTEQIDAAEFAEAIAISSNPAVHAQFLGSSSPSMSLPFNSCLIPRYLLDTLDNYAFSYALAWHVMLPLFPPSHCSCQQSWDPLGLHAAACPHLNAFSLLHNSVRDCFAGAARRCVSTDADARVSYILTDKHAKSATWMHEFYPLKPSAPVIYHDQGTHRSPAPSLSPDILIAFVNDPLNPYFGDFVASSPSTSNRFRHGEAAQDKFVQKLRHYSKHHDYPSRVFYPLSFERSGYIHPAFDEFIDLFARCSSTEPQPHTTLQLRFAVAFAITFTTASLLRSASYRLLPRSLSAFIPPKPLTVPACWAPYIPPPRANLLRSTNTNLITSAISSDISSTADSPSVLYALQGATRPAMQSAMHPAWRGAHSPEHSFSGALLKSRA